MSKKNSESSSVLLQVLADTFVLYFKTHSAHWNITGAGFFGLHNLLEEQYTDMFTAVDDIAERVRALNSPAPSNLLELVELAKIKPTLPKNKARDGSGLIEALLADQEIMIAGLKAALETLDDLDDEASEDIVIQRLRTHEKQVWMLRSTIAKL